MKFHPEREALIIGVICLILILILFNNPSKIDTLLPSFSIDSNKSCEFVEMQIRSYLNQSNYCTDATDCKLISLGYPFGCYNFVYHEINNSQLKITAQEYQSRCTTYVYDCFESPKPEDISCIQHKCVDTRFFN